ncbi:putative RNA methylase/putative DNA-binding transcriptional regulator AlpA [Actinoplanes campanulatus]|uniref:Putative RNA methylase/putative DNA-binding transcriptional regulator AlpA n=1 Tax=Actinoplanes campanulatus TaxID=113559 RepID=A0A7W5AIM4_9ACTN|nr:N-6 DNA methylase [Actinoplanes campanulatus]MBB3096464.1 putative RNA methylase/putative DNA-binding transcriptional regulator AlpA [Actinoplanes campanulatus]GGN18095.1 SAM-dependent methyltransferase [Actinoplanes campanulatus]GID38530.1 SAM-dependent methyltransferase [Actinoplanes campanulatus]
MTGPTSGADGRLISAAEVARLAGVTRAAVSNWRRRHADFPEPVGGGRNALFALSEITGWLDRQRKNTDVSDEVLIWQELRARYGEDMTAGVAEIAELLTAGESAGRLDEPSRLRLRDMAAATSPADVVAGFTERLIASGAALTTRHLARAVAHVAGDVTGTVFDPAAGAGSLLLACVNRPGVRLTGQDGNPAAARLARARAVLAGAELEMRIGDSFQQDAWPGLRADLVVCDPPAGLTDWGRDSLMLDRRWEFGIPTKAESELAWLQHCYAHTAPGGRVVFVMPPSVAYRRAGKRIRSELLRGGVLEQIVALPPGLVASHAQPVHLWVLRRPTDGERPAAEIRLTDLTHADPDEPFAAEPRPAVDVPVIDLLDENVDLTPAAHIPVARADLAGEYAAARERILQALHRIAAALPDLTAGPGSIEGGTLRIADLARAGIVDIGERTATSASDQLDTDYLRGFLRGSANAARNTSGSGTFRTDIRGSRIPQMDLEEQRRYGAAFRALDDAERALRELSALGLDAVARARDGLTSGTLRPGEWP